MAGEAQGTEGTQGTEGVAAVEGNEPTNTPIQGEEGQNKGTEDQKVAKGNEGQDGEPNPLIGAPEGEYEMPQMPEGIEIDAEGMKGFSELAKRANLSQDGLNEIVQFEANRIKGLMDSSAKAWADQVQEMENQSRKDPDIGGAKYDESTATINAGIKKYAGSEKVSQEALSYLNTTGALSHPAVRKMLHNIGLTAREDSSGGSPTNKGEQIPEKSAAQKLFPKSLGQE